MGHKTPFFPDLPLSTRLRLLELRDMERFVGILADYSEGMLKELPVILATAFRLQGVRQRDLSDELGVSQGTVSRWLSGKSLPHPKVGLMVVEWLRSDVRRRAAALREALKDVADVPDWTDRADRTL